MTWLAGGTHHYRQMGRRVWRWHAYADATFPLVVTAALTAIAMLTTAAAACRAPAESAPATVVATVPAAAGVPPSMSPAAAPAASPSAVALQRVEGMVTSFSGGRVVLSDGRSLSVPDGARISRSLPIDAADLRPGDYVAITGKRQPDNTVLASMVNVFPASLGQVAPGQRLLPEGNLMTNATIDQIEGRSLVVVFPGGGARVQLAPDAHITRGVDAALTDLVPGVAVVAMVVDDAARAITITGPDMESPAPRY